STPQVRGYGIIGCRRRAFDYRRQCSQGGRLMLAVLTILAVAMTDLIRLTKAHVSPRVVQFVQLGWWLAVIVAAVIWVRPEAWVGAVAAIVAAAWYFGAERMDRPKQADDSAPSTSEL